MTRFARAKGSKSSNEKVPEEATPWSQLKKGMLTKKEELSEETKKCVSALKSKNQEDKHTEWVNLDDGDGDSLGMLKKHLEKRKKAKANLNHDNEESAQEKSPAIKKRKKKQTENVECTVQKKKNKGINACEDSSSKVVGKLKKKEKSKKKAKPTAIEDTSNNHEILEDVAFEEGKVKLISGEKKKKRKRDVSKTLNSVEENQDGIKEKKEKKKRKLDQSSANNLEENEQETKKISKQKKMKTFAGEKSLKKNKNTSNTSKGNNANKFKQPKKDENKFNPDEMTIDIGGEKVDLVKFQGFYITKEDGERLKELRKKMKGEGIPESQIEGAIKLERRRCEKALARKKRNVCFHCRKSGHVLAQCPEGQDSVDTSAGVCYKCGSTEHYAAHCKVTEGTKYPFAACFICNESGHISRQCPDNPRGLYPKGGCCKLCGDVTHLKKDCQKRISENEEKTIKLGVRDDRNLEGLDDGSCTFEYGSQKVQKKKHVRF